MSYVIRGLKAQDFTKFIEMDDEELARCRARRLIAEADDFYPCRVSLENARRGETLLLLHHVHNEVDTPYRSAFAIFVREAAETSACFVDQVPSVLRNRPVALRGFAADGNLSAAQLALEDDTDAIIRKMFEDPLLVYINAHNAAHGCFAARIERHGNEIV